MMYKILLVLLLIGFMPGLSPWRSAHAQKAPVSSTLACGAPTLTRAQALSLVRQANLALQRKRASARTAAEGISYIPLRPHILRRSDGTGGLSLASLNQVMAKTNNYFMNNGAGIQFFFAGTTPDYIDDDALFAAIPYKAGSSLPEGHIVDDRDAPNAMNQYYVNNFSPNVVSGFARYPHDNIVSTRSYINVTYGEEFMIKHLVPHELGHGFDLAHTFGFFNGEYFTDELVTRGAGANCTLAGDLVCDTPADPFLSSAPPTLDYDNNGCPVYSPSNTVRDANGDPFNPSTGNIMSYYVGCNPMFTPGQHERMLAGLALRQTHTYYSLTYLPSVVTTPTNLAASLDRRRISLTWQDNADNEMGYFIERSTSPTTGFVYIGGVAANTTTFYDSDIKVNTHYYYRIRPSNTTTASISQIADIVTPEAIGAVTGLATTNITENQAQLNWNSLGDGINYDVQWRLQGSPTWNSITNIAQTTVSLFFLNGYSTYEWQVKATDSETYSGPVTFTTLCPSTGPQYAFSNPARVSASLNWGGSYSYQSYTLQWRAQGSPNWNTVSPITGSVYSLTGLTSGTAYEWQVQGVCSATANSAFSSLQVFSTYPCLVPYAYTNTVRSSSAGLTWSSSFNEPNRTYELRYRPVGNPNWVTISNLTTQTYSLTGLANNTQYEWQVKSICSPTESSDYSSLTTFTTFCLGPVGISSFATATTAFLTFGFAGVPQPGSTYEIQFRQVGNPNWTLFTGPINSSYGSRTVTGLATNTSYEWRMRTACTANTFSDYSSVATFSTGCFAPAPGNLQINSLFSSSADLAWYLSTDPGTTFSLRYRSVGAPDWTTLNSLTATSSNGGSVRLTELPNNTEFEWQLKVVCSPTESSTFTPGPNFTTRCSQPNSLTVLPKVASASVGWNPTEPGSTYDVWYRKESTTDWTMVSNITSTNLTIPEGLTGNTNYEWQVRARCADGSYSGFSTGFFRTTTCDMPFNMVAKANTTSAFFTWNIGVADPNTRFELAYRTLEENEYTRVAGLSTDNGRGTFELTGLIPDKQYKWQLRTICSANETSGFAVGLDFFTCCSIPHTLNVTPHPTAATLTWVQPGYGVTYDVRYRLVGAPDWITISNLTSTSVLVSGLTTNTNYEWQVRTRCGGGGDSEFSSIAGFTTTPCLTPFALYAVNITTNSARLTWVIAAADANTRYEGRYRLVGAPDWITLTNLSSDRGIGTFDLTGLAGNAQYEWQIKTICSPTSSSNFTSSNLFQTVNPCPSMYTVKTGLWTDPTVWSCGRIPLSSDLVQLKHVVTIPASYQAQVRRVSYDAGQQLVFEQGSTVQFGQ
ncbi:hypothetical protein GCM10028805_07610 [Spirosoma harenae]